MKLSSRTLFQRPLRVVSAGANFRTTQERASHASASIFVENVNGAVYLSPSIPEYFAWYRPDFNFLSDPKLLLAGMSIPF
jgi:hypothetical protein